MGDFVYVSGQLSHDEKGNLVGVGDFDKQVRQTYDNIAKLLKKFGASLDDVLYETVYVTDLEKQGESLAKIHKKFFPKGQVASTAVGITRLYFKEQLIEVSVIAVAPARTRRKMKRRKR